MAETDKNMKNLKTISFILLLVFSTFGQKKASPNFDIADFSEKFQVAEWLVEYDSVAWKTSDEVAKEDKKELEKLGAQWFCFPDKNNLWHAVYGKYEKDKFNLVFHYTIDRNSKIIRTTENVDPEFLNLHAKSLVTAREKLRTAIKVADSPRFNQYIKQNADKTFTVWLLPAFQTNGVAVYGGEFIYTIDKTGEKITKDESYFQGEFKGFKTGNPREIWLNYRELEKPTLGAIFFVWYYKPYFTKIFIDNAKSSSFVIEDIWVHIEKDEKK